MSIGQRRYMKKQSNTPQIRFQNFEDTWLDSTIGRHISLLNGRAYKQEELLDEGKYKVLRVGNFNTNSKWYYSNLELEENKYVNKGDLLYLWATNFGPEIWAEEKAIYHYHIWKLEFDKTKINQNFLNIWLESDKNKIQQNTNGSTMVHITKTMMEERKISLPNFAEQSAIGSLFRTLDDLLTSYKENLANYQSLKTTTLSKMFPKAGEAVPEIRLDGFEGEWENKILSEVTSITMGQSPKSENYTDNPNDYILVQGNADIKDKRVVPRLWTTEVTKFAEIGDIILTVRAPVGDIGKTDYSVVIGRGVAAIKGNDFIFYTLEKMKMTGFWNKFSTGSTFESISSNDIKEAIIQVPTLEEQQAIGAYFLNLDQIITSYQEKITQLETLKKKLLQDMFI